MVRTSRIVAIFKALFAAALFASTGAAFAQSTATSQVTIATGLGSAAGVAVDPVGNVYAADGANNSLQEYIGANGSAQALIGGLSTPGQLAVDISRNVYVANGTANVVYEYLSTNGALNLNTPKVFGSGLGKVTGVAVDLSGTVYIVDATNKQVVKVTSGGTQSVLTTGLIAPKQIAVDKLGDVYIADAGANAIVYIPVGGTATTIGTGFVAPAGVATDFNNNVFIADTGNNAIKEIPYVSGAPSAAGQVTLAAVATAPTAIAADARGTLYIASGSTISHFSMGAIYFGLMPTKQTSPVTPVTITFSTSVAPASIQVVATGYTGLDFTNAGGGTCSATATYSSGNTCTVNVTFTPLAAGPRMGAIVFYDVNNKVVSRTFIGGGGLGPVLTFDPGIFASVTPNTNTNPISLSQPHGARFDMAGNLLLADTGLDRVVVFPADKADPPAYKGTYSGTASTFVVGTFSLNDVSLDGAGDLIIPDLSAGRVVLFPYENGSWNQADIVVLATGYTKPRAISVDIGGNAFYCDTGANKVYKLPIGGTAVQVPVSTKACLGVAVDLYGNLGVADNTGAVGWYIPVNGQAAYSVGTGFKNPWGAAFDAAGSLYISDNAATAMYRIPNENGTLSTSDQQTLTGNKDYGFAIDANGNIVTTPLVGTTVPASGYNFNTLGRSALTETLGATTGQAVGVISTVVPIVIGNSGSQTPVYVQSTGISLLGDIDDFSTTSTPTTATTPIYPKCNFSNNLLPGFACYIGLSFTPISPGGVRTATVLAASQQLQTPYISLTGTALGTTPTTSAGVALSLTTPTGSPAPGQALVVTAKAATAATGAVTLYIDGAAYLAVELNAGTATFSIPAGLAVGTHTLTGAYAGDATYTPTTATTAATLSITVVLATPTIMIASSGNDFNSGLPDTLTGTVVTQTGLAVPTGTLTFFDGTTNLGTATLNSAGIGNITISTLAAGTHTISISYSGDTVYATGKSTTLTVTVSSFTSTSTALVITPTAPVGGYSYGTALTATATVTTTGTTAPTGTVVYSLDGAITTQALASKQATLTLTPNAGTHVLTASYSGDTNFTSSYSTTSFVVLKDTTVTTLKASSTAFAGGSAVTLTATVSSTTGTPTGNVVFRNGATTLGTVAATSGVATLTTTALPAGADAIIATYVGDINYNPSASASLAIAVSFNTTATTIASSPLIIYAGVYPTLTATLTNNAPASVVVAATGTVSFYVNGKLAGTSNVSGSGNSASLNITAALFATYFTTRFNTISASYGGDVIYSASATTGTYQVYVAPTTGWDGDYSITAPTAITVPIGGSATSATITLTPTGNYFGYVQLGCTGLPLYSNCVINADQVLLNGTNTPVTATLTVLSQAPVLVGQTTGKQEGIRLAALTGGAVFLGLLFGSFQRGRKLMRKAGMRGLLMLLFLSFGLGALSACGGHPPISTQAGTYTVSITGTGSGNLNHTFATQMTFQ